MRIDVRKIEAIKKKRYKDKRDCRKYMYFNLPFKQTERMLRAMKDILEINKVLECSIINRRFSNLKIPIGSNSNESIVIAFYSSDIKIINLINSR
jgi:hypothetical protein